MDYTEFLEKNKKLPLTLYGPTEYGDLRVVHIIPGTFVIIIIQDNDGELLSIEIIEKEDL